MYIHIHNNNKKLNDSRFVTKRHIVLITTYIHTFLEAVKKDCLLVIDL